LQDKVAGWEILQERVEKVEKKIVFGGGGSV
jgi:hypothetical protein